MFILLDAAQGVVLLTPFFIAHILFTIFAEAYFLFKFQNLSYKKSTLYSFEMNLISLVGGLLLFSSFRGLSRTISIDLRATVLLILFFILTFILEFIFIKLVCKTYQTKPLLVALLIGNLITYGVLVLIIQYFN